MDTGIGRRSDRSALHAQTIEAVLRSVEQNNKELQAGQYAAEAGKMEVQTQNNLEDPSVEYSPFYADGVTGMASSELVVKQGLSSRPLCGTPQFGQVAAGSH